MGVLRPDLIIKNVVPVIMAGIIGIYGLVVAVLVSDGRTLPSCTSSPVFPFYILMHSPFSHPMPCIESILSPFNPYGIQLTQHTR